MKRCMWVVASVLMAGNGVIQVQAASQGSAMLVLDASGSMWGQIDGQSKITLARAAVDRLLAGWNPDVALGLMAYGHRRKGDCSDIETLIAADRFDADGVAGAVAGVSPKGMTPISAAVRQAAEQLRFVEQKATVILVSDGEETCHADPCALGRELEAMGVDFTAHVVGFDLEQGGAAQLQLQCLASRTGGRYIDADSADALNAALEAVSTAVPESPPDAPTALAEHGSDWIEGVALEPETGITLDTSSSLVQSSVDFTVDQTAKDCQALCEADDACAGWHYEPTGSYFVSYPRCHFRSHGFAVRLRHEGEGWVAGVKPGVRLILVEDTQP